MKFWNLENNNNHSNESTESVAEKEIHDKFIKKTKENLNILEWEIIWKQSNETLWEEKQLQILFAQEGVLIPDETVSLLPEMRHDVTIVTSYILEKALWDMSDKSKTFNLQALNTNKVKIAVFKHLIFNTAFSADLIFWKENIMWENVLEEQFKNEEESKNEKTTDNISNFMRNEPISNLNEMISKIKSTLVTKEWQKKNNVNITDENKIIHSLDDNSTDRITKEYVDQEGTKEYWWEISHIVSGFMDKMNTISTVMMPEINYKVTTSLNESNSRSDFLSKVTDNNIIYNILWFIMDLFWKQSFKKIKEEKIIETTLVKVSKNYIKIEATNCLKDFTQLNSNQKDTNTISIHDNDIPDIPLLDKTKDASEQLNKAIHVDNFFSTIENRYDLSFIRFSPKWLETHAKNNNISNTDTNKPLLFNKKIHAWEVNKRANPEDIKILMKAFIGNEIWELWDESEELRNIITSGDHLHAYLFWEYVKGRYEYHDTFKSKDIHKWKTKKTTLKDFENRK